MRKKALRKDAYVEIKHTFKRFLSILLIVLLGVGFFAGIKATSPDMKKTVDQYFDQSNVMDIEVISTLGLTDADIDSLKKIEEIEAVMPSYSKDAMVTIGEEEVVVKLQTIPFQEPYINELEVKSGKLPSQNNECVVEEAFLSNNGKKIGDTIAIEPEKTGTEEEEFLTEKEMTIVGTIKSPLYISKERGSTKLGSGKINYYMYLPETAVQSDVYTEAYVTVKNAKQLDCNASEYEELIKKIKDSIKEIATVRKEARYQEVVEDANKKVEEAKQELEEKTQDANIQLEEAKQKLADAKKQLQDSEIQISSSTKKANSEFTQAEQKLQQATVELNQNAIVLEQKKQEANIQIAQAKIQLDTLNTTKQQIEEGIKQIEDTKTSLEQQKQPLIVSIEKANQALENATTQEEKEAIMEQLQQLNTQLSTIEYALQSVEIQKATLQQQKNSVITGIKAIQEGIDTANIQLADAQEQWNNGKQELEKQKQKLETTKTTTYAQLKSAQAKITKGKIEIQNNEVKLEEESKKAEDQIAQAEKQIDEAMDKIKDIKKLDWYILDRNQNVGYVSYSQDSDRIANIGKVFPIVFFVVAALISLTSMTRMVEEERVQIGTLKAMGYNKIQIASKYILYAFLATVIGSLLGMTIGFRFLPDIIFTMYQMMYQLPPIILEFNMQYAIMGLGIATACTVGATIYSCAKELATNPATLMRPKSPKAGKRVLLEKVPFIWSRLKFSQKVTVRNIFRYKKRFLMTIIGICGCTALIVAGFGLRDAIGNMIPTQYGRVFNYQMETSFKDTTTAEQISQEEAKIQNKELVTDTIQLNMKAIKVNDSTQDVQLVVPKDTEELSEFIQLKSRVKNEKYTLEDTSIIITEKLAKLLNIKEGDKIRLKNEDEVQKEVKVGKITENYIFHYVYMTPILYQQLFGEEVKYNVVLSKTEEMTKEQENALSAELLQNSIISSNSFTSGTTSIFAEVMDNMTFVVWVLIVSAGLLAFVVLYNLSNVNISERIRELATIKVLGFYDKEVYDYVARETVILTVIGIIIGCLAGYFLDMFVINTCELDMFMFERTVSSTSYLYAAIITALFTIIVNITTYFSLKKINMIDSLKSIE